MLCGKPLLQSFHIRALNRGPGPFMSVTLFTSQFRVLENVVFIDFWTQIFAPLSPCLLVYFRLSCHDLNCQYLSIYNGFIEVCGIMKLNNKHGWRQYLILNYGVIFKFRCFVINVMHVCTCLASVIDLNYCLSNWFIPLQIYARIHTYIHTYILEYQIP